MIVAVATAAAGETFRAANFHLDPTSARLALWVVILGGLGQNFSSYTSDEAVVQRYMTTPDARRAAASIWLAAALAAVATLLGLVFVDPEIRSLFDSFIKVVGIFVGVLGGLFGLGMLTRRASGPGALVGVVAGAVVMLALPIFSDLTGYLYPAIGITVCFAVSLLASLARDAGWGGLARFRLPSPGRREGQRLPPCPRGRPRDG